MSIPSIKHEIKELPLSKIREITGLVPTIKAERAKDNLPVYNLSIGAPHIPANLDILQSWLTDLQQRISKADANELAQWGTYSAPNGRLETRQAIADYLNFKYPNLKDKYTPDEVMPSSGGTGALNIALQALVQPRTKIALFAPYYPPHKIQIESMGGEVVPVTIQDGETHTQALERVLGKRNNIDFLLLNEPHNPTGKKFDEQELAVIADIISKPHNKGLGIFHERIYGDILQDPNAKYLLDVAPVLKTNRVYIEVFSCAKNLLGLPDAHIGFVTAPTKVFDNKGKEHNLMDAMARISLVTIGGTSILNQELLQKTITLELTKKNDKWREAMQDEYNSNIQMMKEGMQEAGLSLYKNIEPQGTFYTVISAQELIGKKIPAKIGNTPSTNNLHQKIGSDIFRDDTDIVKFLLYAGGVAVVPLSGFGVDPKEGAFRISCATTKDNIKGAVESVKALMQEVSKTNSLGKFTAAEKKKAIEGLTGHFL